jgi:predicted peptidase
MDEIPTAPGLYEQVFQSNQLRFFISIPEAYQYNQSAPLVLALHWGGPSIPHKSKWYLLGQVLPALEELGAVIAAPDCPSNQWDSSQTEADIIDLINYLEEVYYLDPRRVLLTGYSMGGIGAWHLAAHHQDRFSAALIVSAQPPADAVNVRWEIPLYVIHSRQDEVFPLKSTEATITQLRSQGFSIEIDIVERVTHFQTERFINPMRKSIPWIRKVWSSQISTHSG